MAEYVEDPAAVGTGPGERRLGERRAIVEHYGRNSIASGVHRFLGGFPTAFFTLALVTDYAYMQSGTLQYQYFSIWLIVAALITGGFAVLAGIVDWFTGPKGRRGFGWHFGLTVLALLIGLLNAFVHSRDGWVAVVPQGILLSLATVIVLYAGGFIGAMIDRRSHPHHDPVTSADPVEYQA